MTATDWVIRNQIHLTPLQQVSIKALDEQELLCQECMLGASTKMLCSGVRPIFDVDASGYYNGLRISSEPCEKHCAKSRETVFWNRVREASMPRKAVEEIRKDLEHFELPPLPVLSWVSQSVGTTKTLLKILVKVIEDGATAKFIFPQVWYRNPFEWDEMGIQHIETADLVVVERLDDTSGSNQARQQMFSCLSNRVVSGLATIFTLSTKPTGRNDEENEFLQEIKTWPQLKLNS